MELIKARNPQQALLALRTRARHMKPETDYHTPLAVSYERPMERVVVWPELKLDPAEEMRKALLGISQLGQFIGEIAKRMDATWRVGFHLLATELALRFQVTENKEVTATALIHEYDPIQGVAGGAMLQLSLLQELMALAIGTKVGPLYITQTGIRLTQAQIDGLCPKGGHFNVEWNDAYLREHIRPKPITDGILDVLEDAKQFVEIGDEAMGYKSQFVRRIAIPVVQGDASRVAASDWKRAVELS